MLVGVLRHLRQYGGSRVTQAFSLQRQKRVLWLGLRPVPSARSLARRRRGRACLLRPSVGSGAAWGRSGRQAAVAAVSPIGGGRCARRCTQPTRNPLPCLGCFRPAKAITDGRRTVAVDVREDWQAAHLGARSCAGAHAPPPTPPRAARNFYLPPQKKICVPRKLSPTTCSLVFHRPSGIFLAG